MRWRKERHLPPEVKSGFLYTPETLPVGSKTGPLETRWMEYATWHQLIGWLVDGEMVIVKQYWIDNTVEDKEE